MLILGEQTNVDLRRCLSIFVKSVIEKYPELDEVVVKPLVEGFYQTDQCMIIDAVSITLNQSKYIMRMTDAEKLAIHERLKGMSRPSLAYLGLSARV